MAIYHLEAKVVSRGAGRSAVAASAYLSCSRLYNDYDGIQHDYTKKQGLVWQQMFLPEYAPQEWQDREKLWNAVEEVETAKDSRLAREFVVALPIELSREQQIELLQDFIREQFVADGMMLDSLAMHPFVDDLAARGGALADLGTGPGLPGIPLAIAKPGLRVTLVESNGKKARFLREAVRTLKLDNARVAESRAEALDEPQAYDALTARALDVLAGIIEVGGHLLKPGGTLLAMKGVRPDEEIAALPAGWSVATVEPLTVPGLVGERHMVVVRRD